MRLLAAAIFVLAVAVAFTGVVILTDDDSVDTPATTLSALGEDATDDLAYLAATHNVTTEVMQERLDTAARTCDIFKEVGQGYGYLAQVCRFNIVSGEPWWDTMSPRQLNDVAEALSRANE